MAVQIQSGSYSATISERGAGLSELKFEGRDLVVPHDPNTKPVGFSGQVLIPWPNRIAGATYDWEGTTYDLPVNEADTGAALHGLRFDTDWKVEEAAKNSVTLSTVIEPTEGYPFALESKATYTLGADGLEITVTTTNTGNDPAPYGASVHPYLTAGNKADEWTLEFPAASVLEVDENLTPTSEVDVAEVGFDFRKERSLNKVAIDHAFGSLPTDGWTATIRDPKTGKGASMVGFDKWAQIYTGENQDRAGVAVEPMTCPPNAFNSGVDVIVLEPGASHTFRTLISDAK